MTVSASLSRPLLLLGLITLLAACSPAADGGGLDQARQHLDQGRVGAALIEARSLLQKNSLNADAQLLLGRAVAAQGDTAGAEREIRKAQKLGLDPAEVTAALAEALWVGGQPQRLLDELQPDAAARGEPAAELLALRGQAQLVLGRGPDAAASFAAAAAAMPGNLRVLLGQARLALAAKDFSAATALADRAMALRPKSVDLGLTRAAIAMAEGKPERAIEALQQVIQRAPERLSTRLDLARLLIDSDRFADAQAQVDALRKMAPRHPLVQHTQAVLHFRQRQFVPAREAATLAVAAAPDYTPAVRLLAEAELETGQVQQAQARMQQLLQAHPDNPLLRRAYAATLLRINQPAQALETLAPLLAQAPADADAQALAGQAHLQRGEHAKAGALMVKAAATRPAAAGGLVALGLQQVARGDTEQGLAVLEQAAVLDPKGTDADLALALTSLKAGAYDRALAAAQRMLARQPRQPMAHTVAATAQLGLGDKSAARRSLEQALALDAKHAPAAINLALLDADGGQLAPARQRLEAVLAQDPGQVDAITALARLSGQPGELLRLLDKARSTDPKAVGVRLMLVRQHMLDNDGAAALRVAQELQQVAPDNTEALSALGAAQFSAGQRAQALATYTALLARTPHSVAATVRLGDVQAALGDSAAAEASYAKALLMRPDFAAAVAAMVRLQARAGRADAALKLAEDWRRRAPRSSLGDELRGDVYALGQQFAQAARAYDAAYGLEPGGGMAVKQYGALRRAGGSADGSRVQQWLKLHPQDPFTRQLLADEQLRAGDLAAASDNYRRVVATQPGNVRALNNLANVYLLQKDPRSLATAQAALALNPTDANIMDTVGQALVESGAAAQALPLLRRAVAINPETTEYRVHLALALARSGDKQAGRDEVRRLLAAGHPVQLDGATSEALR